jgi:hypothetical protein
MTFMSRSSSRISTVVIIMIGTVIHEDVMALARSVHSGSKHARADKTSKKVEGNHPLYVVMLLDWAGRGGCCMRDLSIIFLQYLTALLLLRREIPRTSICIYNT